MEPRVGVLDRALRLFSDVRAGEGTTAFLMLVNLFLLLVGYYVVKTVREPLILATGGAELKAYASAAQALTLIGFVPLYSWFSSRVSRLKLVVGVTLFFIANLELFVAGAAAGVRYLGFAFFIWVGIFSLASIAQFWSYANDVYPRETGERLFPIIAIGATAGSPVGAKVAERLFAAGVSPYAILHLTAALLVVHLLLYWIVDGRIARRAHENAAPVPPALGGRNGFVLVLQSPYLRLIALLLVLLNVVNSTGEYIVGRSVVEAAAAAGVVDRGAFIGEFYGRYFFWVNVAAVVLQAFAVSRIVRYLGIGGVLLALPIVSMGAYGLIAAGVGFGAVRWAKTAENATDYSVMNTARQLLWLPTAREEKYKAKQAVDTFFVRVGDMVAAGLVFAGTAWLGLGLRGFAVVNMGVVVVWVLVALRLLKIHDLLGRRPVEGAAPPPIPIVA